MVSEEIRCKVSLISCLLRKLDWLFNKFTNFNETFGDLSLATTVFFNRLFYDLNRSDLDHKKETYVIRLMINLKVFSKIVNRHIKFGLKLKIVKK